MTKRTQDTMPLVRIDRLAVTFYTPLGTVHAVRDASFEIRHGEIFGLVGESGCGKSTVGFAITRYLPERTRVDGQIQYEGKDMLEMSASGLRKLRGSHMTMVYQDPGRSLNPSMRVGAQVEEVLQIKLGLNPKQALKRSIELFDSVRLADPENIGRRYPHELSGGMQQRIVIAMALACDPHLLIMDEPTTGLDVTTEATILDLVVDLKKRVRAGILFVTHNLGVIARVADRVAVMYAGQIVEEAPVAELFKNPQHPYTAGLFSCVPRLPSQSGTTTRLSSIPGMVYEASKKDIDECLFGPRCPIARTHCRDQAPDLESTGNQRKSRCLFWNEVHKGIWSKDTLHEDYQRESSPLLLARNLRKFYGKSQRKYILFGPQVRPPVRALVDVGFDTYSARILGIVGESGSGKSTLARTVAGLTPRTSGELHLRDEDLSPDIQDRSHQQKDALRMVFQNPTACLNPKLPVSHVILRSLQKLAKLDARESSERAAELLRMVGLNPAYLERLPGELSGGEQQRVAVAGAFSGNAALILADEVTSALDVSVQTQVLDLLRNHQREKGTSFILISHDLAVVSYIADYIMVLYAGHLAESGPKHCVLRPPMHPYTEALLSAVPVPDPDVETTSIRLHGAVPTLRDLFQGCFFAGRCPRKIGDICDRAPPPVRSGPDSSDHIIYCHIAVDELNAMQQATT